MMLFTSIAAVIRKSCGEIKHASRVPARDAIKCSAERGVMNAGSVVGPLTALALAATGTGACFAALFAMASNVSAAQGELGERPDLPRNTGVFYALCKLNSSRCEGYLTGVADILLAMGNSHIAGGICNAEYDSANLRKVFEVWVERHPDHLQDRLSRTMAVHIGISEQEFHELASLVHVWATASRRERLNQARSPARLGKSRAHEIKRYNYEAHAEHHETRPNHFKVESTFQHPQR